jgi:hypothetical protein
MNARFRIVATSLILGLGLSAFAAAAPPKSYLVPQGDDFGLPKFGFSSSNIHGYGERIVHVRYGGRAAQLGLESGDIILSLNGYGLTYPGSWNDALAAALSDGNQVRLKIRDVRTGHVYFRTTFVDYGGGPIENHYKANSNVHPDARELGSTLKQEVKELFN